jgi:tRNA(Ile)-lysidine synthase
MLEKQTLDLLKNKKNLLAYSGGVDSTALFFLLLDSNINFDIAIVNYGQRQQAKQEILYAKELAEEHNIKFFKHDAKKISNNFEANARAIRYDFFESTIKESNYDNLLTAHHLGDRFEWMLMQFCKGAGCAELSGMDVYEQKENYSLVRPLLHLDKSELLIYLKENDVKYFIDETNNDKSIKRNHFRHQYSNPLLKDNLSGIKKSFEYLDEDKKSLITKVNINSIDDFYYFQSSNTRSDIYTIDKCLKSIGHIITAHERELLKESTTLVIGRKFLVVQTNKYIFISPYTNEKKVMSKDQKELLRSLKIEPKLRNYLCQNTQALQKVKEIFTQL